MESDQLWPVKQEPVNLNDEMENTNLKIISGFEDSRKDDVNNHMSNIPHNFLGANKAEMHMTIEQHLSIFKTGESNQGLEDSSTDDSDEEEDEEEIHQPEHFLSQTNADSDEGMDINHDVVASAETRYSIIHVNERGRNYKMYMCNQCDEDFLDKRVAIRHARAHTWAEKPLQCDQCEMGFDKRWLLTRHLKTHEKTRDYACNVCGRAFYQEKLLIDHVMRLHGEQHQNISRNEDSSIASKESDNGLENSDHVLENSDHVLKNSDHVLENSDHVLENSDHVLENSHHGLGDIREENEDQEEFDTQQHFPVSNRTAMPLTVEPNISINKTGESDRGLENSLDNADKDEFFPSEHFLSQTNDDSNDAMDVNHVVGASAETLYTKSFYYDESGKQPMYSCNVCEKDFKDKRVCIRHVRAHTGEKPFKCHQCGQSFGREDFLKRHLKSHTGEKPFSCPICSKRFGRKDSLDEHLLLHNDMSDRPFPCNHCGRGYVKRFHLERHLKTHAQCAKAFNENGYLIDYAKKPYEGQNPKIQKSNLDRDRRLIKSLMGHANMDEFHMRKRLLSEESDNYEQNPKIPKIEDSDCGIEESRNDEEEKDPFIMPNHFLSTNITEIPLAVEPNPITIKTEENDECLDNSMDITEKEEYYRLEHFLPQSKKSTGEGLTLNDFVGGSAETLPKVRRPYNGGKKRNAFNGGQAESLYTVSRVTDGGRKRNRYNCNLCELDFKDKRNCIRHIRSHTGEKPYPCNQCDKGFDKRWFLERHMKVHEKTRDFICNVCGKAFFQKRHLIDHEMRLHNEQNPDISTNDDGYHGIEERRTDGEIMDALYMQKHFLGGNNSGMPLAVEQDPSIVETKETDPELEGSDRGLEDIRKNNEDKDASYRPKHILSDNNTGMPLTFEQNPNTIATKESGQGLKDSESGLEDSERTLEDIRKDGEDMGALFMPKHFLSTNTTDMPLSVQQNPSIVKTEEGDQLSEDRMDIAETESFYRPEHFLSQTNKDSDEVMDVNHVKGASAETLYTLTHTYETGRKLVRYSCNVCEKDFKDKRQCLRHIRVHTGEKPYKCHLCGGNFGTEGNLSRHIRSHTGEKPWSCPMCEKCFTTKNSLEQHQLLHADVSERPFPCNQCEKGFVKRSHLERHLKTHAQIREFVCTICHKDFSEKRHLLDHTNRRHSNKVQPQCKICNREFWSEYHLRMHMRAHIDSSEEQLFNSFPTFVNKDEEDIQANIQNPSTETSDSHSLFGNVLDINEGGGGITNDAISQQSDTVESSTLSNSTNVDTVEASTSANSTKDNTDEASTLAYSTPKVL